VAPTTSPRPGPAPSELPAALTGQVIWRIPTADHVVALTFDGGSGAQGAPPVLATLRATGVPATFFLTGQFIQTYPQTARAIGTSGAVGNHTMTHPHMTQLSWSAVRTEVSGAESAISATIGRAAKPWFRFPFGESDTRTLGIVNGLGYAAIGWTIDTRGWQGRADAGTVHDIVARVMAKLEPGADRPDAPRRCPGRVDPRRRRAAKRHHSGSGSWLLLRDSQRSAMTDSEHPRHDASPG
jgi:peptidoglycan/xylan/chitin deacetylase (PgdA/CDA1 family)